MSDSNFSNKSEKENFGFILIAIAFSIFYMALTRAEMLISYWKIFISLESDSMLKFFFILSMISLSLVIFLSLLFLLFFFKRKKVAKYVFLTLVLIHVTIYSVTYMYGVYVVGMDINSLTPDYIGHLITEAAFYLLICTPYLFISQKSKNVFINP
ncbi:DUF2569 family protein [Pantoea agglomerans]|uniref:DUF2569 family protein n=1 Tax=Enterobacter agglomerans TaxID=549 RepID=UPI000DAD2E63|nr:DUF2569 family protein [Pantoea agglomerans]RAH26594.1 hypothetical protein DOT37_23325 [Pantoea agglomerans]TGX89285.1 DUF2569 family protein [Pantoea agglomerans]